MSFALWISHRATGADAVIERHMFGGRVVLGWVGEGTRALDVSMPGGRLLLAWGLYPEARWWPTSAQRARESLLRDERESETQDEKDAATDALRALDRRIDPVGRVSSWLLRRARRADEVSALHFIGGRITLGWLSEDSRDLIVNLSRERSIRISWGRLGGVRAGKGNPQ